MTATATAPNGNRIASRPQTADEPREMKYIPFGGSEEIKLTVRIVQSMICVATKSGKVCTETDAMKFMMLCRARKLNPFEGDAFLVGYDSKDGPSFSLITAHQAFLKRAECHPEYDGMESGLIVIDGDEVVDREGDFFFEGDVLLGAWATVHFKNRRFAMKKRVRLQSFIKPYGRWRDDPAGMIVKCAEADALRSSFPTMLGGLYSEEERPAIPVEAVAAKSEPIELTAGRKQLRGTRPAPAPKEPTREEPPANNTTFTAADEPSDHPRPEPDHDQGDANEGGLGDAIVLSLADLIDASETIPELAAAKAKVKASRKEIGEQAHENLIEHWRKKYTQLGGK